MQFRSTRKGCCNLTTVRSMLRRAAWGAVLFDPLRVLQVLVVHLCDPALSGAILFDPLRVLQWSIWWQFAKGKGTSICHCHLACACSVSFHPAPWG